MGNIRPDQLTDAINRELTIYSKQVYENMGTVTESNIKALAEKTKATAPVGKRKKHYKSNITSRVINENSRKTIGQWYVKGNDYRLSHLLEHGHALKDGGRVEGTGFIGKATEEIIDNYVREIEEVLRNG
jgi:hypothetical protein